MSFSEFTRAIFANPRQVGALCPSSPRLARAIAERVPELSSSGVIIELGGGTGAITRGLLKKPGISPQKIYVIERDERLAEFLREEFPLVHVLSGDACELEALLKPYQLQIEHIVSSLPLRSLPKKVVDQIGVQLQKVLPVGGKLIQYTYRLDSRPSRLPEGFQHVSSKIVWLNMPPAKVEVYQRQR